ncbi:MAG: SGNH/GDSL hydrolase family protein [Fimbriimonadaceae bacterium]|nr:SGNH/GDSL hydrolase family protein [Chthonomonadaceae bacterium]MCO5297828.1 SGNH/GDSL hydrolase family protein [Fimbriimonadaceae bacterium]
MLLPLGLLAIHLTGGQIAQPAAFARPLVGLLEAKWPGNRTVTIVCHGHSVPAGFFVTPTVQTFDAYPHLLHEALAKKYPHAVVNVIVTAIGGEASDTGAARFERDVMSLKPDVVTIDYGLNDRRLGLDAARAAWESMIEQATKGGAKVILLTPSWDQSAHPEDPKDPLSLHAEQIRGLAKKYGTGLADSFDAFLKATKSGTDLPSLMSQVNHPNRAGHELILKELLPWFGIETSHHKPRMHPPQPFARFPVSTR